MMDSYWSNTGPFLLPVPPFHPHDFAWNTKLIFGGFAQCRVSLSYEDDILQWKSSSVSMLDRHCRWTRRRRTFPVWQNTLVDRTFIMIGVSQTFNINSKFPSQQDNLCCWNVSTPRKNLECNPSDITIDLKRSHTKSMQMKLWEETLTLILNWETRTV